MNSATRTTPCAATPTPSWNQFLSQARCPPLQQLAQLFSLRQYDSFLQPSDLNALAVQRYAERWRGPAFIPQSVYGKEDDRYYEQIVAQDEKVPTRENNWHDLFNGLVWLQFPVSKAYINRLHVKDIDSYGLHPRTHRRHRLTHFDECGVILAVDEASLTKAHPVLEALAHHDWQTALLALRSQWGKSVLPFVFGHANLEMLLNPFVGLTGKWLAVKVSEDFTRQNLAGQLMELDIALKNRIRALADFDMEQILRPLPLLGIPGWHHSQNNEFYKDEAHFRPQRSNTPRTSQLPLI